MRSGKAALCCAALMALGTLANTARASLWAVDNASDPAYADGWQAGDNGGFGWGGGWSFRNGANTIVTPPDANVSFYGAFVGDSRGNNNPAGASGDSNGDGDINTTGNKSWGLYANTSNEIYAIRPLAGAMSVGQILRFSFDNGLVDSTRVLGVRLLNSASDIASRQFEVRFVGGDPNYNVVANPNVTTTIPFSREGIDAEFQLTSATTYSLTLTRKSSGAIQTITGSTVSGLPINGIAFRNLAAGTTSAKDGFFNSISVPEPAAVGVVGLTSLLIAVRRRRNPI
jgi:hypothetical protein